MKPLELPFNPPEYTDEDIGLWLVAAWRKCRNHAAIELPHSLPNAWKKKLAAIDPAKDSGSISLAPLESALRKVIIDSDLKTAGKMIRAYIIREAAIHALAPVVHTGMKVRAPMEKERKRRTQKASSDVAMWQKRAEELWLMPQHRLKSKSDIARLIDPNRWNTIRKKIQRP